MSSQPSHQPADRRTRPERAGVRFLRAVAAFFVFNAILWPPYYAATTHGWATTFQELQAVPIVCAFMGAAAAWVGRPIQRHLVVLAIAMAGLLVAVARGFATSMVTPRSPIFVLTILAFGPVFLLAEGLSGFAQGLGLGGESRMTTGRRVAHAAAWALGLTVVIGTLVLCVSLYSQGSVVVPERFRWRLIQVAGAVGSASLVGGPVGRLLGLASGRQLMPFISVAKRLACSPLFHGFVFGYLLLGGFFAEIYWGLWVWDQGQFYIDPTADRPSYLGFLYYSFVTLSTTGYGEIRPVHLMARGVACLEMTVGVAWMVLAIGELVKVAKAGSWTVPDPSS